MGTRCLVSNDPDYEMKKQRVMGLFEDPPEDGVVVCISVRLQDQTNWAQSEMLNKKILENKAPGWYKKIKKLKKGGQPDVDRLYHKLIRNSRVCGCRRRVEASG